MVTKLAKYLTKKERNALEQMPEMQNWKIIQRDFPEVSQNVRIMQHRYPLIMDRAVQGQDITGYQPYYPKMYKEKLALMGILGGALGGLGGPVLNTLLLHSNKFYTSALLGMLAGAYGGVQLEYARRYPFKQRKEDKLADKLYADFSKNYKPVYSKEEV